MKKESLLVCWSEASLVGCFEVVETLFEAVCEWGS